jgi:prepilin-type N-terminal cleavage/methylation domain-containing protein
MHSIKSAFTIIELLIVLGILVILASLLFPVFSKTKASAKSSIARSNMRQSVISLQLYSADCDGLLPCYENTSKIPLTTFNDPRDTWSSARSEPLVGSFAYELSHTKFDEDLVMNIDDEFYARRPLLLDIFESERVPRQFSSFDCLATNSDKECSNLNQVLVAWTDGSVRVCRHPLPATTGGALAIFFWRSSFRVCAR